MTGPPAETRVIRSRSLNEITRPLTDAERRAFEEFKRLMREEVIPEIVRKVRARRRAAAGESWAAHSAGWQRSLMAGELRNLFIGPGQDTCLQHWEQLPCPKCDARMRAAVANLLTLVGDTIMSWSASTSNVAGEDVIGALRDNFAKTYPNPTPEVAEQFAAAIEAVGAVLLTVQPEKYGGVTVSLSGHANPGHKPAAGWSNDSFSMSLTQVNVAGA